MSRCGYTKDKKQNTDWSTHQRGMDYCDHSRRRGSSHDINESSSGDVREADLGAVFSQCCKEPRN